LHDYRLLRRESVPDDAPSAAGKSLSKLKAIVSWEFRPQFQKKEISGGMAGTRIDRA
jgi:hypothetical protein